MEGIHRVVLALAHYLLQARIVVGCNLGIVVIAYTKKERTHEVAGPVAAIATGSIARLRCKVGGHHTRPTGQYGLHTEGTLCGCNLSGKFCLAHIPGIVLHTTGTSQIGIAALCTRSRTTPSFEVVHCPPSDEGGTCHEGFGLLVGESILAGAISLFYGEELAPYLFETYELERHVDAVQGHPVNLLLPASPCP